jgi:hypothetical protein
MEGKVANNKKAVKVGLSQTAIQDTHLFDLNKLKKVSISNHVKTLPKGAFYKKKELSKIYIDPNIDLRVIPEYCFGYCESLKSIIIPDSVVTIEAKAFCGCTSISQIEVKQSVSYLDPSAFDGWRPDQRIYVYRNYELSDKCQAKIIDISEDISEPQRVITKESDLSLKKYIVRAKCGHVGRDHYIPIDFPITATSKKEAAKLARLIPRVKHDHEDAIIFVKAVTDEEYANQIEKNRNDVYLSVKSKHDQKKIENEFNNRLIKEPNYTRRN